MKKILILILFFVCYSAEAFDCQWMIDDAGKYYLADSQGERISARCYDYAGSLSDSLAAPIAINNLSGAIDVYGNEIVPCVYDYVFCDPSVSFKEEFLQEFGRNSYIILGEKWKETLREKWKRKCAEKNGQKYRKRCPGVLEEKRKYFAYDLDGNLLLKNCYSIENLLRGYILFEKRKGRLKIYSIADKRVYRIKGRTNSSLHKFFSRFDANGISIVSHSFNPNTKYVSYLFGAINTKGEYVVPCIYKDEEEVMKLVGRTKHSFYFHNK